MRLSPNLARHIHFVGIGGIGMSGIAEVLFNLGYKVSGSDVIESANIKRLRELGLMIHLGHDATNITHAQIVVVSTAVSKENPEVLAAKQQGIAVVQRAEMLAELMRLKFSVAISGTHGKTTTTSLMAALFDEAGLHPTIINGGILNAYHTNARLGSGDWVIAEADESDGSFTKLFPTFAVVTNIDEDHMDFYKDFDDIRKAFSTFLERIPFYGAAIMCVDHPEVEKMAKTLLDKRVITYGFSKDAHVRGVNIVQTPEGTSFDVDITPSSHASLYRQENIAVTLLPRRIKNLFLPMVGMHNVQNVLSVVAMALELGFSDAVIKNALSHFKGVKRRFTQVGQCHGMTIIDDYAHHPVEIQTTLKAARQATTGRVIAVLQPHRYSRLNAFFEDFVHSLDLADIAIIAPVFSAGESPLEGVNSTTLAQRMHALGHNVYEITEQSDLAPLLRHIGQPGDLILCMGAGSITYWAASLPQELETMTTKDPSIFSQHPTTSKVITKTYV